MVKLTFEYCKDVALQYNNRTHFQKEKSSVYNKSLKNGWLDEICSHMVRLHKPNNYWTIEKCKEIALQYNNRNDMRKNDSSCYRTSLKNGWLDEICEHMNYVNTYWDIESCKKESLKYTNRKDFQTNSKGAYEYAKKHNILNDICKHMIKVGDKYNRCIYVFEFDDNSAYVGLTYNLNKREKDHKKKGPIKKHLDKTNKEYKLKQLTDYIDVFLSQELEEKYIKEYKENGWNMLNTQTISTIGCYTLKK